MAPRRAAVAAIVLLALAALLSCCGCGKGDESNSQNIERRPVIVYSPHGQDILDDFKARFEAAHPEYRVVAYDMGATVILDRLRGEQAHPRCDVWWGAPEATFMRGAAEGLLRPHRPSWAAHVSAHQHDPQDRWYGVFRLPIVLGYNKEITDPATLPASWDEVVHERYRDQIALRSPIGSGTMTTLFTARVYQSLRDTGSVEGGFQWLRGLDANTASYQPNAQAMYDAVARDPRGRWTLWGLSDLVYQSTRPSGAVPFGTKVLAGETPVILDCIGLIAGSPEAEGARLFYEHVTSPDSLAFLASRHAKIPVRGDIDPATLPEWMRNTGETPMTPDWQVLAERTAEWMNRWDLEIEGKGKAGK